jgi:hypothetical protein
MAKKGQKKNDESTSKNPKPTHPTPNKPPTPTGIPLQG